MDNPVDGAKAMEAYANAMICSGQLMPHLAFATRNRRFREAFAVSSAVAYHLWCLLNVANEGPAGGQPTHLLWALLFLKTYGTIFDLSSRCGVDKNTYRKWTYAF